MKGCEVIAENVLAACLPFLSSDERHALCQYLGYGKYPAGETIMRQGEPGDFMGFVVSGKLAVKKETAFPGKFILVALLQAGAMVGEISVVSRSPRTAMVVAVEESELLLLSHEQARNLLADNPALALTFLKRSSWWWVPACSVPANGSPNCSECRCLAIKAHHMMVKFAPPQKSHSGKQP